MTGGPPTKTIRFDELDPIPAVAFLIVTAVDIERDEMLKRMTPLGGEQLLLKVATIEGTYYVGTCGRYACVLATSEAGSGGRGGSALTVADAIERWRPYAVLLVGIAFGADAKKQVIGDVLASTHVIPYELQRVSKGSVAQRAPRPEASQTLLDRVRHLDWSWTSDAGEARACRRGSILSGDKLVDSKKFRDELILRHPNAEGGEMEGAGLYAAADRRNLPWLIIKAICDWGYNKDKRHQPLAAANACSLVERLLTEPTLRAGDFNRGASPAESRAERTFREQSRRSRFQELLGQVRDAHRGLQQKMESQHAFMVANEAKLADLEANRDLAAKLAGLNLARLVAVEAHLNAYGDAAAALLNGEIDRAQFADAMGAEIRELCTSESDDVRERLHPRESSSYEAIWRVYDELVNAKLDPGRET